MSEPNKTPQKDPQKLKKMPRTAPFWFVVALLGVIGYQFVSSSNRVVGEISLSELYRQLESDNILEATIHGEQSVEGQLK
ncbi:MAG: hypothetical protein F4187_00875, partial [Gemmatimonadetes bacterium]|nr:hypothetical protein [Gemmatimonadota bacterium]